MGVKSQKGNFGCRVLEHLGDTAHEASLTSPACPPARPPEAGSRRAAQAQGRYMFSCALEHLCTAPLLFLLPGLMPDLLQF